MDFNSSHSIYVPIPYRLENRKIQEAFLRTSQDSRIENLVTVRNSCAIVESVPFDSECFKIPMGRVDAFSCQPGSEDELIRACLTRAADKGISHLTVRVPASDVFLSQALTKSGFLLVDTLATLVNSHIEREKTLKPDPGLVISTVTEEDIPDLVEQSETIYRHSRYFNDPNLTHEGSRKHIGKWITNDCQGRSDVVFVGHVDGQVSGFIACMFGQGSEVHPLAPYGVIDLIAVFGNAQGRGVGTALVQTAMRHYRDRAGRIFVGTQGGNAPAIRLYQSNGFQLADLEITYHGPVNRT